MILFGDAHLYAFPIAIFHMRIREIQSPRAFAVLGISRDSSLNNLYRVRYDTEHNVRGNLLYK